jgi:hypothetical protein
VQERLFLGMEPFSKRIGAFLLTCVHQESPEFSVAVVGWLGAARYNGLGTRDRLLLVAVLRLLTRYGKEVCSNNLG